MTNKTVKVYRLECPEGKGPYSNKATRYCEIKYSLERHPSPLWYEEADDLNNFVKFFANIKLKNKKRMLFGFKSTKQMYTWFSRFEIDQMYSFNGTHIVVYEVPENRVVYGNKQVVFYKPLMQV